VPKRLLIIGRKLDPYPPFDDAVKNATLLLADTLARQGVSVRVLSYWKGARYAARRARRNGVPYLIINRTRWPRILNRVISNSAVPRILCRAFRADAVYFHGAFLDLKARKAVHIYSHQHFDADMKVSRDTAVLAENDSIYERAKLAYPSNEVHLVYPGVDLAKFRPRTMSRPRKQVKFVFASSTVPEHDTREREIAVMESRGVFDIIKLTGALSARMPVETTMLWRKDTAVVDSFLAPAGPVKAVRRYVEDMNAFLDDFDFCFCLFKDDGNVKGIPQSMIECMAKGIPIVTYRDGPLGDLVREHGFGVTVSPGGGEGDIDALARAATVPEEYSRLSANAVATARRLFDIEATASKVADILFPRGAA